MTIKRIRTKLSQMADNADKSPDDNTLSSIEMSQAKLKALFQKQAREIKTLYQNKSVRKHIVSAMLAVAEEYKVDSLTILKWVGVTPRMPQFSVSKYGITSATKRTVWNAFVTFNQIPPSEAEIDVCDLLVSVERKPQSILNNASALVKEIRKRRGWELQMEAVKNNKGLTVSEYVNNPYLVKQFAKKHHMTEAAVVRKIRAIFKRLYGHLSKGGYYKRMKVTQLEANF